MPTTRGAARAHADSRCGEPRVCLGRDAARLGRRACPHSPGERRRRARALAAPTWTRVAEEPFSLRRRESDRPTRSGSDRDLPGHYARDGPARIRGVQGDRDSGCRLWHWASSVVPRGSSRRRPAFTPGGVRAGANLYRVLRADGVSLRGSRLKRAERNQGFSRSLPQLPQRAP